MHLAAIKQGGISDCTGPTFDDDGDATSEYSDAMFDKLREEMKELHEGREQINQSNSKRQKFAYGHSNGTAPPTKRAASTSSNAQQSIAACLDASQSTAADAAVCRFFYANKLAFKNCATLTFKEMVHEVSKAGAGYIFGGLHHLSNAGIETERARLVSLNAKLRRDVIDEYGVTLCSDGKADVQSNPLINALIVHLKGVEHIDTFNATGITKKTGLFLRALFGAYLCETDYDPDDDDAPAVAEGEEDDDDVPLADLKMIKEGVIENDKIHKVAVDQVVQILLDGAAACRKAMRLLQARFPHLFGTVDTTHSLDRLMLDVCGLEWVSEVVSDVKELFYMIKHHDVTLAGFKSLTHLKLKTPGDTRFKYAHIMLERALRVATELNDVFSIPRVIRWSEEQSADMQARYAALRDKATSEEWWTGVTHAVKILTPIAKVLTWTDTHQGIVGDVYVAMLQLTARFKDDGDVRAAGVPLARCTEVLRLVESRWEYLHSEIHVVGALVNPKLWADPENDWSGLRNNRELKVQWMTALERFFPGDVTKQLNASNSLRAFWAKEGVFGSAMVWGAANRLPGAVFWDEYGFDHEELQLIGRRVLAQPTSMTCAERNWKEHSEVHCPKRNQLNPDKARDLVFVASSLRLQEEVHRIDRVKANPAVESDSEDEY